MLKAYDKDHFYYNDLLIDLVVLRQWLDSYKFEKLGHGHSAGQAIYMLIGIADYLQQGFTTWMGKPNGSDLEKMTEQQLQELKKVGYNLL